MNPRPPAERLGPAACLRAAPREFRAFFASLLVFLLFAAGCYILLVCLFGFLATAAVDSDSERAYLLKSIPRNLQYALGYHGHLRTRAEEARQTRDVDVLVIGSSHAYRGFDPRIFRQAGLKTFVLGSSAQSHLQTRVLLERYLDRLHPRMVLYEVYPRVFSVDGVESALDLIANDQNDFASVKMALKMNHVKVYHALIFGFFRNLLHLDRSFEEPLRRGLDTYVPGGYIERSMGYFKETEPDGPPFDWAPRRDQVAAFEKNLAMIRARNIRLILIQAPWPRSRRLRYPAAAEYDARMKSHGEYYNFNQFVELDDNRHFLDESHMNQAGVEIFNRELIRRLLPAAEPEKQAGAPSLSKARAHRQLGAGTAHRDDSPYP